MKAGDTPGWKQTKYMTEKQRMNCGRLETRLCNLGFSFSEIKCLIRIERTLHRWAELCCGTDAGCIERDETTGKPTLRCDVRIAGGRIVTVSNWVADRESGALRRLDRIMSNHPTLAYYHQTDPRGCALYVFRRSEGLTESTYHRGVAICI